MKLISNLFIPLLVLGIILYGVLKKVNVYDSFIEGAKEGLPMVLNMFPPLLAMILGINIFTSSGLIDEIFTFLKPLFILINIPLEILPIAVMRPLSGSFGLALLNNMFANYGPDNFLSIMASIIQGSSDTTIYIITLYFGSIGITKIKYALWAGLLADLVTVVLSLLIVPLFF